MLHRHVVTSKYNSIRAEDLCWRNFSTLTELANLLVAAKNVPFREAHRITGLLTQELIDSKRDMQDTKFVIQFLNRHGFEAAEDEVHNSSAPNAVPAKQTSVGATGPRSVEKMLSSLKEELNGHSKRDQLKMEGLASTRNFSVRAGKSVRRQLSQTLQSELFLFRLGWYFLKNI
ncbi:MAG TPA: hypothetical protein VNZ04_10815 [Trinickia sp.]|nr:hypothetical protein [Trinickia sp.]